MKARRRSERSNNYAGAVCIPVSGPALLRSPWGVAASFIVWEGRGAPLPRPAPLTTKGVTANLVYSYAYGAMMSEL